MIDFSSSLWEDNNNDMIDFSFFDEYWTSTWNLCSNWTSKIECEYNIAVEKFRKKISTFTNSLVKSFLEDVVIHKIDESRWTKMLNKPFKNEFDRETALESYKAYVNAILNISNEKVEKLFSEENLFNRFNQNDFISNDELFINIIINYIYKNS